MIRTIFLVSIQNKHFYLQLIINLADGLLKYRTMRLFLIFLNFSILPRTSFFLKLLVFCSLVRLMLSGDIELNPGPHLENLIEYSSYLKNRGTKNSPLFFLINCQSLKNKFEEFANILKTAPINTFVAVTETWLDTDCNIENNFLTASHTFFGKCRSEKTGASKGGGVGIFVPKKITADVNSSLETVDEFF